MSARCEDCEAFINGKGSVFRVPYKGALDLFLEGAAYIQDNWHRFKSKRCTTLRKKNGDKCDMQWRAEHFIWMIENTDYSEKRGYYLWPEHMTGMRGEVPPIIPR